MGAQLVEAPDGDESTLVKLAREVDAIGTNSAQVTEKVIRAVPRCRIVARFGIGLDNICIKTATELGIRSRTCRIIAFPKCRITRWP